MKTKFCNTALLMCLPLILLMACQVPPTGSDPGRSAGVVNYVVELSAAKGASEITVTSPDQGCNTAGQGKKGCVQCEEAEICTIQFTLNPGQTQASCQASSPPDWVITKVELSAHGDAQTEKGVFPKRATGWMVNAFPKINVNDGTVYVQPDTFKATQSATIIDLNNHRKGTVKTAYYQVTASSCTAGIPPIMIDPAIKNTGK